MSKAADEALIKMLEGRDDLEVHVLYPQGPARKVSGMMIVSIMVLLLLVVLCAYWLCPLAMATLPAL